MYEGVCTSTVALAVCVAWAVTLATQTALPARAEDLSAEITAILSKADEAYGEYLSGQCVTCHHAEGESKGIPSINGLPDTYFVQAMLDYRHSREERTNPAMVNVAKNLSDEELGSLARHFSRQPPQ